MPPRMMPVEEEQALRLVVGARIKAIREEKGMTPVAVERLAGGGFNVSALERGGYLPRVPALLRLAKALGVTTSHILGDLDPDADYRIGYRAALSDAQEQLLQLQRKGNEK